MRSQAGKSHDSRVAGLALVSASPVHTCHYYQDLLCARMWTRLLLTLCFSLLAVRSIRASCEDDYKNCTAPIFKGRPIVCGKPALDMCTLYEDPLKCINETMTACMLNSSVSSNITNLMATRDVVCRPEVKCKERIAGCSCILPHSIELTNVCSKRETYLSCLNLTGECATEPSVQEDLLPFTMYDAYCTKATCQPAVKCVVEVMDNISSDTSNSSGSVDVFDICGGGVGKLLQCMDQPNCTQGPVTGGQLSSTMANMCIENETVIANTSQCQAFSTCMGVLNLFPNVTVTPLLMMDLYINVSQPNFWCSLLSDLFTCLNNGTKICSLPANVTARVEQTYNNIVSLCSVYTPAPPERSTVPISGTNPLQDSLLLLLVSCMATIILRF